MKTRRDFLRSTAVLGTLSAIGMPASAEETGGASVRIGMVGDGRTYWAGVLDKIARPVLENLARRELKKNMPVEEKLGAKRADYTHLEAFGRLLCGMAPWLAAKNLTGWEQRLQQNFIQLARQSLDAATDSQSPDFMNFTTGGQPLVDTAFLAQGILRASRVLWEPLEPRVQAQVVAALKSSRKIGRPRGSNWVMFAAMVEAALLEMGEPTQMDRLEDCVRDMLGWYCGDGAYGDGEAFHFDYYNSFVIQPMLLEVLEVLQRHDGQFAPAYKVELARAGRFAEVQERLIAPDGTFPALGRSITYRFGALQVLAQMAWRRQLPAVLKPAQVRSAMTAVIRRMMLAPGTFDSEGWLQIGFCGHQPALGEHYISTGSLYLCTAGMLPLGLPPEDEFWRAPEARWTAQKIWSGEDLPADHALADTRQVDLPDLKR